MRSLALFRLRVRMSVETLMNLAFMALAVALVIGFQVLRFRLRSADHEAD